MRTVCWCNHFRADAAIVCLLGAILFVASSRAAEPPDAATQNQRLGRGVNILGYDPIWQNRHEARLQEKHFRLIREAGFSNVRVNLHPFRDGKLGPDHRLSREWFDIVDWAVKNARANGLMAILDCHEYLAMGDDPRGNRERLLAVWRQIAERYKDEPDDVLFEILNEPCEKLTPELWNPLLRDALKIIRATNPRRTVLVGPTSWNSIDALPRLDLPEDRDLIVTVHYYSPFAFTHQGAPWTSQKDTTGVAWNATDQQRRAIEKDFALAASWARQHRRPIFLGEFGALEKGDMDSRARWTSFVARQAEKLGWSWAYWQLDINFAVYDAPRNAWVEPIRRALVPSPASRKQ